MPVLRSFFIALASNRPLRRFSEHSWLGIRVSSRFIAGMKMEDALRVTDEVNQNNITVSIDVLGESVTSEAEARAAAAAYHNLLDVIAERKLKANISMKLTQMGLTISPALAEEIAEGMAKHAKETGSFVRIDMEDSTLTQVTMDVVHRLNTRSDLHGAIGIVIQAYLFRSQKDIEQLVADGTRVRLCKGAYDEPATVAFPRKADVDANYLRLSKMLLDSGVYHGFATHDEKIITAIKAYAKEKGIDPSRFEFQMLYGLRPDLQRKLVEDGYNMRVYVPYGDAWYPYYMRRLAERPANVLFMLKNVFHF